MENIRFDNRVAIITGGARGLGLEYAKLLSARGANVIINDNAYGKDGRAFAEKAAEEINRNGGKAIANVSNVEDKNGVLNIVETAKSLWGKVDILVHSAGTVIDKPFLEMDDSDWFQEFNVHLNGAFYLLKAVLPIMINQNYGRIVLVTSSVGMYGLSNHCGYGAAKMGVFGLAQSLKQELKNTNVVCNLISPLAATGQTSDALHSDLIEYLSPEYVAILVAYLCSEKCVSGRGTYVAGGGYYSFSTFSEGKGIGISREVATIEEIAENVKKITDMSDSIQITSTNKAARKIFSTINKNKG